MPVIEEIGSASELRLKQNNKWDNRERIFHVTGKIREGKLRSLYMKMFGAAHGSVRVRKNSLKMVPKSISNQNPLFRIGESAKFYGFSPGQIKDVWLVCKIIEISLFYFCPHNQFVNKSFTQRNRIANFNILISIRYHVILKLVYLINKPNSKSFQQLLQSQMCSIWILRWLIFLSIIKFSERFNDVFHQRAFVIAFSILPS